MISEPKPGVEPLRVLHAVNRMDLGGIETFLMRVYREIEHDRVQFDFLAHRPGEGAYDDEIRSLGGQIFNIDFSYNPARFPGYRGDALSFFYDHPEFKVVHSHLNAFNGIFLSLAARSGVPVKIAHIHAQSSGNALREPLWNLLKKIGRKCFSKQFACSSRAGRWAYGRDAEFSVIQNAIPLDAFAFNAQDRQEIRQEYGLGQRTVIGHVGAFRPNKNQRFLLPVLDELRRYDPTACLFFLGEGEEKDNVSILASEMGLSKHVVFAGEVSKPERYYSAMDVLAFPSVDEGLGIVAIEAQASGLPCVLSTGVPDEAAVTDLAIRLPLDGNRNIKEWTSTINELSARSLARDVITPGLEGFDIKATARQLQEMYLAMADEQRKP
ncbi:glycosyltransferase family 1 protein [Halomonas sp. H10-9-1]|uniref:glycosyltransferase family 1 protein n=1 Tax=Halomonas sp. H10-9-1 TaxID=2950871 RepID=UPI0032DEA7B7